MNNDIKALRHVIQCQCDSADTLNPDEYKDLAINLLQLRHKEKETLIIVDEKVAILDELNRVVQDYIDKIDVDLIRYENELGHGMFDV